MEAKKNEKIDLKKKKPLFFSVGLLVTMLMVVSAFEWKQIDKSVIDFTGTREDIFEKILEIPPTELLPPEPPKIEQPLIVEVPDEKEIEEQIDINIDVEVTQQTKIEDIEIATEESETEKIDEVHLIVEESAIPKGGYENFYQYIQSKLKYPSQARRMGVEGKVYVEFVIGKDGAITDVKLFKGIGAGCDEEAVRVVENAPPWNPGKQRGKPVRQKMILPIIFKLG